MKNICFNSSYYILNSFNKLVMLNLAVYYISLVFWHFINRTWPFFTQVFFTSLCKLDAIRMYALKKRMFRFFDFSL